MPIRQASRTIIFEEFNYSTADRLDLLLGSGLTQQQYYEINRKLSVKSFDEFLGKFNPAIYENLADFTYSLEKPDDPYSEYCVKDDKLYRIINEIYENQEGISLYDVYDRLKKSDDMYNYLKTIVSSKDIDDDFKTYYIHRQESFLHQMVSLIEKVLSVKAFFDHAAVNGIVDPEVLIANCKITDLMDGDTIENNFKTYVKQMGNERTDWKIWYAVVPGIRDAEYADADEVDMYDVDDGDVFDDDLEVEYVVEGGEKTVQALDARKMRSVERGFVSYDDFSRFMRIMNGSNIMVFFNFKANDYTSFANLKVDTVKSYKRKVQNLENKEFGVLCYPNFTVIPKEHQRYELIAGQHVELPSVYLDSSYVACAMMILAHNNAYLRDKGFTVNGDLPAVRFDYEVSFKNGMANDGMAPCWQIITTKLNRENLLTTPNELREELNENGGFGFCFCGDEVYYNGEPLKNTYVYRARTILKEQIMQANGEMVVNYCPIFKPLVKMAVKIESLVNSSGLKDMCKNANNNKKNINNLIYDAVYGSSSVPDVETVVYDGVNHRVSFKYSSNAAQPDFVIEM